jgi:adenylyltransferase/sulfurtransferase
LTAQLKDWTGGVSEVQLETTRNLRAAFEILDGKFPQIGQRILDDQGNIRSHVNVFVNSSNAKELEREETRLVDGDVIYILPSIAGG